MSRPEATPATDPRIERAFADLEAIATDQNLPLDYIQRMLLIAVRAYAGHANGDPSARPFARETGDMPTDTEVVIACSAMLEATGIEVFELGLWRAWSGTGAGGPDE